MKTIAVTIEEDMLKRIDHFASERGSKAGRRSNFIRKAVQDYLSRLERLAEEERETEIFRRHRKLLHRQAVVLVKEQASK